MADVKLNNEQKGMKDIKHQIGIRSLAVCLVLCLLVSLFPGVTAAAGEQATARLTEIQAPENSAVPRQQVETPVREDNPAYADTDEVRVVIVLEEPSVLEKGYSPPGFGRQRRGYGLQ